MSGWKIYVFDLERQCRIQATLNVCPMTVGCFEKKKVFVIMLHVNNSHTFVGFMLGDILKSMMK